MSLQNQRVYVVGGGSGIGYAVAKAAAEAGARVVIGGRTREKLESAAQTLAKAVQVATAVEIVPIDVSRDDSAKSAFETAGALDHIFITAATGGFGQVRAMDIADAKAAFETKFWGAWRVAQWACVRERGSITFTSGMWSTRPNPGASHFAAINAGLEGLTRALAVELAPTRVNCLCPGVTATDVFESMGMTTEAKEAMFRQLGEKSPIGRVLEPEDVARTVLYAMTNPGVSGAVLHVDGGSRLV